MKIHGNGQAKILTPPEIAKLFKQFTRPRDAALFAICFFTGCRISEARQLKASDIAGGIITFRKATTKGKSRTRTIPVHPSLARFLAEYPPPIAGDGYLFPGNPPNRPISRNTADRILRSACRRAEIQGCSTHSFRRTALTHMSRNGVPLRTIQEISGHSDLHALQKYLEVSPEEVQSAINKISW